MSITSDPLFVAAEVAYRRETLTAGLPGTRRGARHGHGIRLSLPRPRLHHRHTARHA